MCDQVSFFLNKYFDYYLNGAKFDFSMCPNIFQKYYISYLSNLINDSVYNANFTGKLLCCMHFVTFIHTNLLLLAILRDGGRGNIEILKLNRAFESYVKEGSEQFKESKLNCAF